MEEEKENLDLSKIKNYIKTKGIPNLLMQIYGIIFFICFISLIVLLYVPDKVDNCYTENVTLNGQYITPITNLVCRNCLVFNLSDGREIYFGGESKFREDLNENITIRWCYFEEIGEYRVRGIKNQHESLPIR